MIAIKSIAAGLALFAIVVLFVWLGSSFAYLEWQSLNPADWSKELRCLAFVWLCGAVGLATLSDKHE